jgi:CBS domain containing-hemolysin-like protein
MILLGFLLLVLLIMVSCVRPRQCELSEFELARRSSNGDNEVSEHLLRAQLRDDILTVRQFIIAVCIVSLSVISVHTFGWGWGFVSAVAVVLFYPRISAFGPVRSFFQGWYDHFEPKILPQIASVQRFIRPFRGMFEVPVTHEIQSRDELIHSIANLNHGLLTPTEQKMASAMLHFEEKKVKDYMTPRSVMDGIGAHELLGPLVLDGLHKTGHSHFPVYDGDIDHIIGILHIHSLFNLGNKKSHMVRDVMEPNVYYIHEDQSLSDTLAACIKKRRHLLVVINEFRETVGVITIEDAVEQLIGQKIIDQFDRHDDLRVVAARNPRGNNIASKSSDV